MKTARLPSTHPADTCRRRTDAPLSGAGCGRFRGTVTAPRGLPRRISSASASQVVGMGGLLRDPSGHRVDRSRCPRPLTDPDAPISVFTMCRFGCSRWSDFRTPVSNPLTRSAGSSLPDRRYFLAFPPAPTSLEEPLVHFSRAPSPWAISAEHGWAISAEHGWAISGEH